MGTIKAFHHKKFERYISCFHLFFIFCIIIIIELNLFSQVKEEWVARYNVPGNGGEQARAIAVDSSGNVYVTGDSVGSGTSSDYATIKYNSAGAEQWVSRYNVPGNGGEQANAIAIDSSGNVYVTGESIGPETLNDYATIKYNSSGVEQWVVRYNGPGNKNDYAYAIVLDSSGNVYVTGYSASSSTSPYNYDYATIKYNSSGVEQWVARYNGPGNSYDEAYAIAIDTSGNVYVTGGSKGSGPYSDFATIKYNSSGAQQWVTRYNGPINDSDVAQEIAIDSSGNVYVTGESWGSGTYYDYATIKYNSSGVQQWLVRYNGSGNIYDYPEAMAVDSSGNVYVSGCSVGSEINYDYATIKYNSAGVQQWVARYSGGGNDWGDEAYAIALDSSGNVYVTGHSPGSGTYDDYATIKYNSSGVQQWIARYNGPGSDSDWAWGIALDNSGNVYVTGWSYGSGTDYDYATIKYSQEAITSLHIVYPTNGTEFISGVTSIVKVQIKKGSVPILGAKVSATLSNDKGNWSYTDFNDAGINGDETANDGVYSKIIALPSIAGTYTLNASGIISGTNPPQILTDSITIILSGNFVGAPNIKAALEGPTGSIFYLGQQISVKAYVEYPDQVFRPGTSMTLQLTDPQRQKNTITMSAGSEPGLYTAVILLEKAGRYELLFTATPPAGSNYAPGHFETKLDVLEGILSVTRVEPVGTLYSSAQPVPFKVNLAVGSTPVTGAGYNVIVWVTNINNGQRQSYDIDFDDGSVSYRRDIPFTAGNYKVYFIASGDNLNFALTGSHDFTIQDEGGTPAYSLINATAVYHSQFSNQISRFIGDQNRPSDSNPYEVVNSVYAYAYMGDYFKAKAETAWIDMALTLILGVYGSFKTFQASDATNFIYVNHPGAQFWAKNDLIGSLGNFHDMQTYFDLTNGGVALKLPELSYTDTIRYFLYHITGESWSILRTKIPKTLATELAPILKNDKALVNYCFNMAIRPDSQSLLIDETTRYNETLSTIQSNQSLSSDFVIRLKENILGRFGANDALLQWYLYKGGPLTHKYLMYNKPIEEKLKDFVLNIGIHVMAKITLSALADGPGMAVYAAGLLVETFYKIGEQWNQMSEEEYLANTGQSLIFLAVKILEQLSSNQIGGMIQVKEAVINKTAPPLVSGEIVSIRDYLNGEEYFDLQLIQNPGFPIYNLRMIGVTSAYSIITICNNSEHPVYFRTLVTYTDSTPKYVRYAFNGVSNISDAYKTDGVYLNSGEEKELIVDYEEALGSIAESLNHTEISPTGLIINAPYSMLMEVFLLATDDTGTYLVTRKQNKFGIDININPDITLMDDTLLQFISPPITQDYWIDGNTYNIIIRCYNPFPEPITVTINQPIPLDATIIDVGDGVITNGSIDWRIGLSPYEKWQREILLSITNIPEGGYFFPKSTYSFYYTGDNSVKVYESNQIILKIVKSIELININLFDKTDLSQEQTDSQEINIDIETTGVDPSCIMLSENINFDDSNWQIIETPTTYKLSSSNGEKIVYAKVKGYDTLESNVMSDSIILNTYDNAQTVSNTIPLEMSPGQKYKVSVTLQNTGASIWPQGWDLYRLGAVGDSDDLGGQGRYPMPKDVYPVDEVTIEFYLTAPIVLGTYTTDWRMVKEKEHWFGEKLVRQVIVKTGLKKNNSDYITDNIPNEILLNKATLFTITFKNIGNVTWTKTNLYKLGVVGDKPPSGFPGRVEVPCDVIPGEEVTFSFSVKPLVEDEFTVVFKMLQENVEWFGESVSKTIKVVKYTGVDKKIFEIYE